MFVLRPSLRSDTLTLPVWSVYARKSAIPAMMATAGLLAASAILLIFSRLSVVLVICDATLNQLNNAVLSRVGGVHGGYQRVVAEVKL